MSSGSGYRALLFFESYYGHLSTEQVQTIIYLHYFSLFVAIPVAVIICNYIFDYFGVSVSWLDMLFSDSKHFTAPYTRVCGVVFLFMIPIVWFLLTGILHFCIVPIIFA